MKTVRRNELHDATIRFIVTRGIAKQVVADPRDYDPTIIIWAAPYIFLADEEKRNSGIRLFISHLRSFIARHARTRAINVWTVCIFNWPKLKPW